MVSGGRRGSAAVLCLLGLAASQICYTRAFTPLSGSRSVHRRSRVRQVTLINQGLGKGRGVLPYGLPLLAEGGELEVEGTPPPPPSSDATTSAAAPATPDAKPRSPEAQRLALEAERLKLQAEKLRLEAEKERLVLEQEKLKKKEVLIQAQDSFIKQLRSRWKGGVEVEEEEEGLADFVKRSIDTVDTTLFLRLADLAEMAAGDATEREELIALSQDVMRAVEAHDAAKATQLSESIKKSLMQASGVKEKTAKSGPTVSERELVQKWVDATMSQNVTIRQGGMGGSMDSVLSNLNLTALGGSLSGNMSAGGFPGAFPNVVLVPLWVPPGLLSFATAAPEIKEADVELLKSQVFGIDTFYVTGMEKSPYAVLFRGNLRGQESRQVFKRITERLEAVPDGLSSRIQLFLMEDPSPRTPEQAMEEDGSAKPVFIAISKEAGRPPPALTDYGLSIGSLAVTSFTAFAYGIGTLALNAQFFDKLAAGDLATAAQAIPVTVGILGLLLVHELAHAVMAKISGLKLGPPVFIPSLQVGTFGAITPFLEFPKDRNQLFDVSAAGPLVGALCSVAALAVGLVLTGDAPTEVLASFPVLPAGLFHSSLLVGLLSSVLLPSVMLQTLATPIPAHPLVIIGIVGAIVNALNLMPIGRLDGGRAASAVLGRRPAALLGTLTLLFQAVSAIFNNYSLQLFWGLVVILFQRAQDLPAHDEVSPTDEGRSSALIALLAFALATLLPFPQLG